MSPEEIEAAKRALRWRWCAGAGDGKHVLRKKVIDGRRLGWCCIHCGFESIPKKPEP